MNEDQTETYRALSKKRAALVAFLQTIQQDDLEKAKLELQLVSAMISELLTGAPISLPSKDELERIKERSTIVLYEAKKSAISGMASVSSRVASEDAEKPSAVLTETYALINTWPR